MSVAPAVAALAGAVLALSAVSPAPRNATTQQAPPVSSAHERLSGAVIAGRVSAAGTGEPVARATVRWRCGTKELAARTAPDGSYEVRNVPPGRCYGSAEKNGFAMQAYGARQFLSRGRPVAVEAGSGLRGLDFKLSPAGVITGHLLDETGQGIADVVVTALRRSFLTGRLELLPVASSLSPTDDRGEFRIGNLAPGGYYLVALHFRTMIFYPGTDTPALATRLEVRSGEEAVADFSAVTERRVRVSGVVLSSRGGGVFGDVWAETGRLLGAVRGGGRIEPGGRFELSVPPGDYQLTARLGPSEASETGRASVSVGGVDIGGLALATEPDVLLQGRVRRDDDQPLAAGVTVRAVRLGSATAGTPADESLRAAIGLDGGREAAAGAEGSFAMRLSRGRYLILPHSLPDGFATVEVKREGRPVGDGVLDLTTPPDPSSLEVVVSAAHTVIDGNVLDETGERLREAVVVVFPSDPQRWSLFRQVMRLERTDQEGRFLAQGLPPGSYLAVALEDVDEHEWPDPEFLERLVPLARKVRLDGRGPVTLSLIVQRPK